MNRKEFSSLVANPQLLTSDHEETLANLIDDYPYFQTGRLLLTKLLKKYDSFLLEDQLHLTALYCSHRERLFELLEEDKMPQTHEVHELPGLDFKLAGKVELTTEPEVATQAEESQPLDTSFVPQLNVVEETVEEEVHVATPSTLTSEDELEKEYAGYDLERSVGELDQDEEIEIAPAKEFINEDQTFAGWLTQFDQGIEEKKDPKDLINAFLKNKPTIERKDTIETSGENLARKATLESSDELVTETLARIHAKQGDVARAIQIYEKLVLKYPEKKAYFAAQIEILKQQK